MRSWVHEACGRTSGIKQTLGKLQPSLLMFPATRKSHSLVAFLINNIYMTSYQKDNKMKFMPHDGWAAHNFVFL